MASKQYLVPPCLGEGESARLVAVTRRAQIFFFLYVAAVAYLSLFPGEFLLYPRGNKLLWYPLVGRRQIMDAGLNVLFYVPLGAAGVWSFRKKAVGWAVAVAAGIALSALIEWLQLWSSTRYGTLNDLATNSLGTILGATAALVIKLPERSRGWVSGPPAVLLITWFLWHAFPFAPRLSLTRLTEVLHPEPWSWITFVEVSIGAAALGSALDRAVWRWVAYAALPAQLCLLNHGLSYAALLGGAIGFVAASWSRDRIVAALAWGLPAWMLLDELRPFAWRAPVPFTWAPFATWYESSSERFYSVLFGKLFLSVAAIWCLRNSGLRWWQAMGIPALILAIGEFAQRWIEGRTPESTDVVLVAIAAILLRLAEREKSEGAQLTMKREEGQIERV